MRLWWRAPSSPWSPSLPGPPQCRPPCTPGEYSSCCTSSSRHQAPPSLCRHWPPRHRRQWAHQKIDWNINVFEMMMYYQLVKNLPSQSTHSLKNTNYVLKKLLRVVNWILKWYFSRTHQKQEKEPCLVLQFWGWLGLIDFIEHCSLFWGHH